MVRKFFASLLVAASMLGGTVSAQQGQEEAVWVQIEAHPNLQVARTRAQDYAGRLADVNGFSLGGTWYGILLGPYLPADAQRVLQVYRGDRLIPSDSFIAYSRNLGAQFWPEGANVLNHGVVAAPVAQAEPQADTPAVVATPSDETPTEARRSERLLSADERRNLQIALRAAGFYNSVIDGSFGRGTRRSMSDWQVNNGFEATGILTTAQRKALMDQYNEPLISVGMARVGDARAGIEMDLPAGVVGFDRYEPPFAHYEATSDALAAKVLLISQPGTQSTLFGLYDIMQTLEIVPLDGARQRGRNSFTLEGHGKTFTSYTEASLENGEIKGFTLIWPNGDEARRQRVLEAMKASFGRTPGVLDPAAGADTVQDVDLVAGLEVRKPRLSRSGFYVDGKGTVITTSDAAAGCTRITLDEEYQADLVTSDERLGIAVLRPQQSLAPMSVARFRAAKGRLQSEIAVAGFSYEGKLGAPTLTFGTLADVKGLRGETGMSRLALNALPGDAGGPVLDAGGGVLGMLLPKTTDDGKQLPADVSFAADADSIRSIMDTAGLSVEDDTEHTDLAPAEVSRIASGMTVLVSCWD
ncbi:serine protease [Microbulbifer sp. S227A]|uniref:serine protease n=1 Tax=Microbulbifer sp. S227A TaxID=3415131 RepID=UPI003C7CB662